MAECLRETLHLYGGFEGNEHPVLRVKVQQKPIREIRLVDNPDKRGSLSFWEAMSLAGRLQRMSLRVDP